MTTTTTMSKDGIFNHIVPKTDMESEKVKRGTEELIKKFQKQWNIKKAADSFYNDDRPKETVEDKDRKIGEIWQRSSDGKWVTKIAENTYAVLKRTPEQERLFRDSVKIKDTCPKCKKKIQSENELRIFHAQGKCLECIAEEDMELMILGNKQVQAEISEHDIIIKDHANRPVMTLAQFRETYGDEEADQIKSQGKITLNTVTDEDELAYSPNAIHQLALEAHANIEENPKSDIF